MRSEIKDNILTLFLEGRIDSSNAKEKETEIMSAISSHPGCGVIFDAGGLEYISSAGLRTLMLARKTLKREITIKNVSPDVYEIFSVTGFVQMFDVRRRLREISVEGLPLIGAGANGRIYRLDKETIVKVYNPITNPPEKIVREKETAKQAFIHGIPSAISFDMVSVGDRYGIVYEMLDTETLGAVINGDIEHTEEYGVRMAKMLKKLHSTEFEEGVLPDARTGLHVWADVAAKSGCYEPETISKLNAFIDSIPPRNTFIHGDFHPANIMVRDGEWLLIDMGDASVGHPIVDLLGSYQIMKLVAERSNGAERYTGLSPENLKRLWKAFVCEYFGTKDEGEIAKIEGILKYYAIIRSLAGVTFSDVLPDEVKKKLTQEVQAAFLSLYDKYGNTLLPALGL